MKTHASSKASAAPIPIGLRQLWREAKAWVAWLLTAADRTALPAGVSREQGAKVSIWLMNIEGAVRRLILAAALAFTLPQAIPRAMPCALPRITPRKPPAARRPGFCVFRLAASGDAPAAIPSQIARPAPTPAPRPFGHIPFPADPLLSLGAHTHHPRATAPRFGSWRALHPLDRWVPLSRRDPDWRPPDTPSTLFGYPERPPAPERTAPRGPRRKREPQNPDFPEASLYDWRRRYDEWQKSIPAPDLAARLDALERITADPAAAIASAARRLARSRQTTPALARRAIPRQTVPRRAAHLHTDHRRIDLPARCHAAIPIPDTS